MRAHAASALGRLGGDGAAEVLNAARKKKVSSGLGVWLDEALVRLGDKKALRRLQKAARDKNLGVSFKAALALADVSKSGDKKTIKALVVPQV